MTQNEKWLNKELERIQTELREKNNRIVALERENAKLRAGYPLPLVTSGKTNAR